MKKFRRVIRAAAVLLISLIAIPGILILVLNFPFTLRFATSQVNRVFEGSNLPINVRSIRNIGLRKVNLQGVGILDPGGDTLIFAETLESGYYLPGFLKAKVQLNTLQLSDARVDLSRMSDSLELDIAEAFSNVGKKGESNPEKGKKSWEISIEEAWLSNICFRFTDIPSGFRIWQEAPELTLHHFTLSLGNGDIYLESAELEGSEGGVVLTPHAGASSGESGSSWNYGFGEIALLNFNFSFENWTDSLWMDLSLAEGSVRARQVDIPNKVIGMDKILLSGATAIILTGVTQGDTRRTAKGSEGGFAWNIRSDSLIIERAGLQLGTFTGNMEFPVESDFILSGLDAGLSQLLLSSDRTSVMLEKLRFRASNGFSLENLHGSLESDPAMTRMELSMVTGNSNLRLKGEAGSSFFRLIGNPASTGMAHIRMDHASLSLRDIACFASNLEEFPWFSPLSGSPILLSADMNLKDSLLRIPEMDLTQPGHFGINLKGTVADPFHPGRTRLDLQLGVPEISSAWLREMLLSFGIGEGIPDLTGISMSGNVSDQYLSPGLDLALESDQGNLGLSGSICFDDQSYSIHSVFDRLRLGELLANPELGSLSGSGQITGTGLKPGNVRAKAEFMVDSLGFHGYNYTSTNVQGNFSPDSLGFEVQLDDPALKGWVEALMIPSESGFAVSATTSFRAQLHDLQLYKDTLDIQSSFTAHFIKSPKAMEADLGVSELNLVTPRDQEEVSHMMASFHTDSVRTTLSAETDFLHLAADLGIPIDSLGSVGKYYSHYFMSIMDPLHEDAGNRVAHLPGMQLSGSISYHDALGIFIRDTAVGFSNLDFSLINRTADRRVRYHLTGDDLEYHILKIGDLNADLTDSAGIMDLQVDARDNSIFASEANHLSLHSRFANWKSLTDLSVINNKDQLVYNFEIASRVDSNLLVLSVPSGQLIMNQNQWNMDTSRLLSVDLASKVIYPAFELHREGARIKMTAEEEEGLRKYNATLDNVAVSSLVVENVIPGNPSGSISGLLFYRNSEGGEKNMGTNLKIKEVEWSGLHFNDLEMDGSFRSRHEGDYFLELATRLDSSKASITSEKRDSVTRSTHARFDAVPVHTIQPFVRDYLSDLRGVISGDVRISSEEHDRKISGDMAINDAHLKVNALNASFKIPEDSVTFKGRRMVFDRFRVLDSLDNPLQVDGYVDFDQDRSISTDLAISSSRLQVMNKSEDEEASFYGKAIVDSRLTLKGPLKSPVVKGTVLLSGGSELFYRHLEDLSLSESEKIITFVNHSEADNRPVVTPANSQGILMGSSIQTRVEIDPSTRIHFNLSKKIYHINLVIRGGGSLNYQMLRNNQMTLSGSYEINEGTADVKMVGWPNKSFRITQGGYVRWNGLVENPELKFEAVNRVRTSYVNPVDGKRREVDFNVVLQLANQLSELIINFTINTPDQYLMSIINTLSPEEKMRQAITVLLFENIDLPGISTSTDYMTEQVNQLVASQLNQLTKTTIKGVDISFGLDSYKQSTQGGGEQSKTSLSYEVRKGLLNERAQLEVSGRLNDLNNEPGASDLSLNNISFEYRLDSAATKFLKVYNEHVYEDVFEGEVVSTGIGITYRKRYSAFRDIWRRDGGRKKKRNRHP